MQSDAHDSDLPQAMRGLVDPVSSILLATQVLLRESPEHGSLKELLALLEAEAQRLRGSLRSLARRLQTDDPRAGHFAPVGTEGDGETPGPAPLPSRPVPRPSDERTRIAAGLADVLVTSGAVAALVHLSGEPDDEPTVRAVRAGRGAALSEAEASRILSPLLVPSGEPGPVEVESAAGALVLGVLELGPGSLFGDVAFALPAGSSYELSRLRLSLAANQAALALSHSRLAEQRRRLLHAEQRKSAQLQRLADAALALRSQTALADILDTAADAAANVISAQLVVVAAFEPGDAEPRMAVRLSERYAEWRQTIEQSAHPLCEMLQSLRRAVRWAGEFTPPGLPERHPPLRGYLAAPLVRRDGRVAGYIQLADKEEGEFSANDEALLTQLAAMTTAALEQADLVARLRSSADYLADANSAKSELIGMIAHEVRSPLTVIYGLSQILARGGRSGDAEERHEALRDIARAAERLDGIVQNMLVLSRSETGESVDLEPVLVDGVVEATIAEHLAAYPAPHVRLSTSRGAIVVGHEGHLRQVLLNLLSNAAKYAGEGGPIDVDVRATASAVEIAVSDRGPGIPEVLRSRMFEPFVRGLDSGASGLGLGLTVCQRLLEAMGGGIRCAERDGGGTVFVVSLPSRSMGL